MLTWFPSPYPDELFYSVLCRYYLSSGIKEHYLVKEIAYHPEPKLTGGRRRNILHIHEYDRSFKRSDARWLTQKELNLFQKYFIGVNNDQR